MKSSNYNYLFALYTAIHFEDPKTAEQPQNIQPHKTLANAKVSTPASQVGRLQHGEIKWQYALTVSCASQEQHLVTTPHLSISRKKQP